MHKGGTTKVMCAGGKYKEGGKADMKQAKKPDNTLTNTKAI